MRRIVYSTLLFLLLSLSAVAQNGGINFQGMARNAAGEALGNQKISLRLSVLLNSESGTVEYSETKEATTSGQGIFSVVVGDGSILTKTGNFSDINWKNSPKFLKVELDPSGGTNFALMGTSRLQAVPFAYYANGVDAENIQGTLPVTKGGTGVGSITALKTSLGIDQVNNTTDANKPISTATQAALDTKVDKVTGKGLSANDYSSAEKSKLAAITGTNTGDQDLSGLATTAALAGKVDKVTGKELSSNDYSTAEKTKLAAITGTNTGDQDLSALATNTALALKANTTDVTTALNLKANTTDVIASLATKVDKVTGKELSSNDYSTAEKNKLAAITGTNTGDQDLSGLATTAALAAKANTTEVTAGLALKANTADVTTALATKANSSGVTTSLALKANTADVTSALATKANASDVANSLALKENAANKSTATNLGGNATSDDFFPTQKAVKTYVDAQVTNGGIQDGSIQTRHIANGAVSGEKLSSSISGYKNFVDGAGKVVQSNAITPDLEVPHGQLQSGGTSLWQSFTAGMSGKLWQIEFETRNASTVNGPAPEAYVEIYNGSGVSGTRLGFSPNVSISGFGRSWKTFDLGASNIELISGNTYTARLVISSSNQDWVYGGEAIYNSGTSNVSSTWDHNLKTNLKPNNNDPYLTTGEATNLYGGLVSNATHTGEVTGATSLTITDGAVTTSKLANSAVDLTTKVTGLLPTANIADGAISTTKLANNAVDLTTKVTGTLAVANGGTGATTLTANNVLLGNGTSALQAVSPGTNGNILTSNGTTWTSAAPSGILPTTGNISGDMIYWDGNAWVKVAAGSNGQALIFSGGKPVWTSYTITSSLPSNTVFNAITGKIWMDRNLGATRVATSSTDAQSYGDLYQWGRGADGHQIRTSATTVTTSINDEPGNALFIISSDWRTTTNNNLWQGVNGVNNPCPSGFRLPTSAEWEAERLSWVQAPVSSTNSSDGAFASPLKLPVGGRRDGDNVQNVFSFVGQIGYYWSSTISPFVSGTSNSLHIFSTAYVAGGGIRADGYSVRCIKD